MTIVPIPYSQFIAQDSILSTTGGSWHCSGFGGQRCIAASTWWNDNQTSIYSYLQAPDTSREDSMSVQAAVLVDLTSFGGVDELAYSWSFLATTFSDHSSEQSPMPISSSVGGTVYADFVLWQDLTNNETWANASYFLHTGTIVPSGNGPLRVIELSLNVTVNHLPSEILGTYIRHLQLGLGAATAKPTPISSMMGLTASSARETAPTITSESFTTIPSNPVPSVTEVFSTPKSSSNTWIIGASVGGVIFVLLLALLTAFLWKRRRRIRRPSVSKVRNLKRVSPLLSDNYHTHVIDIARHESGLITPFYLSPATHNLRRSRISTNAPIHHAMDHQRSPPVPPPPSYLENPSSPSAELIISSPTSPKTVINQYPYSHHRISIF